MHFETPNQATHAMMESTFLLIRVGRACHGLGVSGRHVALARSITVFEFESQCKFICFLVV